MTREEAEAFLNHAEFLSREELDVVPILVQQLEDEKRLCYEVMSVENKYRLDGLINSIDEATGFLSLFLRRSR